MFITISVLRTVLLALFSVNNVVGWGGWPTGLLVLSFSLSVMGNPLKKKKSFEDTVPYGAWPLGYPKLGTNGNPDQKCFELHCFLVPEVRTTQKCGFLHVTITRLRWCTWILAYFSTVLNEINCHIKQSGIHLCQVACMAAHSSSPEPLVQVFTPII